MVIILAIATTSYTSTLHPAIKSAATGFATALPEQPQLAQMLDFGEVQGLTEFNVKAEILKESLFPTRKERHLKIFKGSAKRSFQRYLENGRAIERTVKTILKEEGLPLDLFFVGLIERGILPLC